MHREVIAENQDSEVNPDPLEGDARVVSKSPRRDDRYVIL